MVVGVPRREYAAMSVSDIRGDLTAGGVLYDLKGILPLGEADCRLQGCSPDWIQLQVYFTSPYDGISKSTRSSQPKPQNLARNWGGRFYRVEPAGALVEAESAGGWAG